MNAVPVVDVHNDRKLIELTSSLEMAHEAAEAYEARQLAYALLDDAADLESQIGNRLRAVGSKSRVVGAFKCSIVASKVCWCRCHHADATVCPNALAEKAIRVYAVTVERVKVEPKTKLLSAIALNGRDAA